MTDEEKAAIRAFISKLGSVASAKGWAAGVGASELAGWAISALYANPEQIERFMNEGGELFIDGTFYPINGALTYMTKGGDVISPSELREEKGLQQ